jgi:ATP-dependent helicase Lhr and Lhr-like helicase
MAAPASGLEVFHPLIRRWFIDTFGRPTDVQAAAWPRIAAGEHVLVSAPTGTGKTLTAFLWALHRLLTGEWPGGRVRVLYVSPLKALNNDIQCNLVAPLAALERAFDGAGAAHEPVRVMTRSGDTPSAERQRMLRRPPEILITTPESLNILLTSQGGRSMLHGVRSVVFDEIHAAIASKRGTHWITAVDRLVPLAGEFQRIALSATARPLDTVARFVGGYTIRPLDERGAEVEYRPRPVAIVTSARAKEYDLRVEVAGDELADATVPSPTQSPIDAWQSLAGELASRIAGNRSTLIFANSRRTTERLTRLLNEGAEQPTIYSHHGSLSRELRSVVERRLKDGELRGLVATNSLELGIDIGTLDEVDLVQTPPTVAAAVQRLGRAGHGVGEVSRGRLYPLFERDLLSAAVVCRAVLDDDIEAVVPIAGALDVLAQVVLSMTATEAWDLDVLYAQVRASQPYHRLSRRQFDLVLEMLAGRYADTRIRELAPRLTIDRVANTAQGRRGAALAVFMAGGTIPDRGYYNLRLADSMARIGELDEEFVWERRVGDTFSLGAQNWRVRSITHSDVLVTPAQRSSAMAPFWRADSRSRSYFLSTRIGDFLAAAEADLAAACRDRLAERLRRDHRMSEAAAEQLVDLLERQREATGVALPHRRHLVVEHTHDAADAARGRQAILHTGWGGRVNRPLAIAIAAAWGERSDLRLEIEAEDDCILLGLPPGAEPREMLDWVRPDNLESLLRARLQHTGLFGGSFRENAGRALLLPRSDARRRVPLWLTRERAKKLLDAVTRVDDFPIVVETWRSCLHDVFDLDSLRRVLDELAAGEIAVSTTTTATPSPFAAALVWQQTNRLMYEDDVPRGEGGGLSRTLLRELVFSSQLRPLLPAELLDSFQRKLHRTVPGYPPFAADDLLAWLDERLAMPPAELAALLEARRRELDEDDTAALLAALDDVACVVERPAGTRWVSTLDRVPRVLRGLDLRLDEVTLRRLSAPTEPPSEALLERARRLVANATEETAEADAEERLCAFLGEWLRFYGPLPAAAIETALGVAPKRLDAALEALVDGDLVVVDRFRREQEMEEVCDAENLERLLRLLRAAARPSFAALPLDQLPLLLAAQQNLLVPGDGVAGLEAALEALLLYPAAAAAWESDLLPTRLAPYYPAWLDSALAESDLAWLGVGNERVTFAFPEERALLGPAALDVAPEAGQDAADGADPVAVLAAEVTDRLRPGERRPFEELVRDAARPSAEVAVAVWRAAWAGTLTSSRFAPLRRGVLQQFRAAPTAEPTARPSGRTAAGGRRAFSRWRSSRPFEGDWYRLPPVEAPGDALEGEELGKEVARLLLGRYGIVFRQLLDRELPALQWSGVFRSLRLMELSGEVVAGHFFDGIPGPQFLSQAAWRRLSEGLPQDRVYWLCAIDPAAPSGLALDAWRGRWPARRASNHLVFEGARCVVRSQRHGAELDIAVPAEHPRLPEYLRFLKVMLTREFQPRKAIDVETINGEPAADSPFAATLRELFSATREPKCLRLRRRY